MSSARPYSAYMRDILSSAIGWGQIHTPENDLVEFQSSTLPINVQAQLVLGAIGGSELVKISRHTAVQGQDVLYQPLADVNAHAADFQSKTLINYVRSAKSMVAEYNIDLDKHFDLQPKENRSMNAVGDDSKPSPLSMSDDGKIIVRLDTGEIDSMGVEFDYVELKQGQHPTAVPGEVNDEKAEKVFGFFPPKNLRTYDKKLDS